MTTTSDSTSASSILSQYALSSSSTSSTSSTSSSSSSSSTGTDSLGEDTFLKLLVTQLQNQNPLDPQDNSEFVAQLAQFSSLEGINTLNDTVDSLASNYTSSQALQASSLVGHSVLAEATSAAVDTSSGLTGQVAVSSATTDASVSVYDADGTLVKNIDLGSQSAGTVSFTWDGTDNDGNTLASGTYTFAANATVDGSEVAQTTYLPSTVTSVTLGSTASDMTLKLADGSSVKLSDVTTIGL
ncbi:flagellar hook assembly protein FlgD [Pseudomonas typographi]|uniref:Basal-body rod modification protein FlgD n=1 Tax=Pseudomonas typographi TaxID=2715964 RepID=A0ABR7YZK6_9PSED|nr:flagellar hook assembly protein FlgD [Pseudomonas typographi]MBD1550655.1 flagellar hook assembly protein FlgD [Pseudomonas typographi]MBD1586760.1 flagellar hook assembly protein FlgD [Pseudomonas typographi]MBD1598654.1 flagellar hook assembly protein FlgD [Pseudomonas typographi]